MTKMTLPLLPGLGFDGGAGGKTTVAAGPGAVTDRSTLLGGACASSHEPPDNTTMRLPDIASALPLAAAPEAETPIAIGAGAAAETSIRFVFSTLSSEMIMDLLSSRSGEDTVIT